MKCQCPYAEKDFTEDKGVWKEQGHPGTPGPRSLGLQQTVVRFGFRPTSVTASVTVCRAKNGIDEQRPAAIAGSSASSILELRTTRTPRTSRFPKTCPLRQPYARNRAFPRNFGYVEARVRHHTRGREGRHPSNGSEAKTAAAITTSGRRRSQHPPQANEQQHESAGGRYQSSRSSSS